MDSEDAESPSLNPNETSLLVIALVEAILSLLGSLFIILTYVLIKRLRNFAFKLVVCLSISDVIISTGNLFTGDALDGYTNDSLCYLQSVLKNYGGLASVLWTTVIAYTLYSTVVVQRSILNLYGKFVLFGFGIPLLMTGIPIMTNQYGRSGNWCWIKNDPNNKFGEGAMRFFQFYLPLWVAIGYNTYSYLEVIKCLKAYSGNSMETRFIGRLKYYPLILVFCWTLPTLNRIYTLFYDENPTFNVIHTSFAGLQGFLNAIVYGCTASVRQVYSGYICCKSCAYDNLPSQDTHKPQKSEETQPKIEEKKIELQDMRLD